MNPVIEAIMTRRSVRSYDARSVPSDLLKIIIKAGNEAPSAMNSQPWRFVVIQEESARRSLLRAAKPAAQRLFNDLREINPERVQVIMQRFRELEDPIYYEAPVIIFVIGSGRYASHSCPLACENMLLAAHSLGLGCCWVGLGALAAEDSGTRNLLDLKDDETVFGPILVGYPKEHPERPLKKEPQIKWL